MSFSANAASTAALALSFPTGLTAATASVPSASLAATPDWSAAASIAFLASSAAFLASSFAADFSASESLSLASMALSFSANAASTAALALSFPTGFTFLTSASPVACAVSTVP